MIQKLNAIPMKTVEGKLTLFGVFTVYQDEIAENCGWGEGTLTDYRSAFKNTIVPCIADHHDRPIDAYTPDFIDSVVARISERGHVNNPGNEYAPDTLSRFRRIMTVTLRTAINHALCPDVWKIKEKHRFAQSSGNGGSVIRYFSPGDELQIIRHILKNAYSSGEMRGLYIMMCTRCRENEAAGLTWGMIRDNDSDPRRLSVTILQTTKLKSTQTKLGGKTANAPRQITLTLEQSEFIRNIRRELEMKWVKQGGNLSQFNRLRFACRKNKLSQKCSSRHLSEAANEMFSKLALSEMLAHISGDLVNEAIAFAENPDFYEEPPEISATCYTLRRAAATFDRVLGIEMQDRKYLMGHVVPITAYAHTFIDADHQCILAQKASERPGVNNIQTSRSTLDDTLHLDGAYCDAVLASFRKGRKIVGWITTEEPGDQLRLEVRSSVPCELVLKTSVQNPTAEYSWYVNVKRQLHKMYAIEEMGDDYGSSCSE